LLGAVSGSYFKIMEIKMPLRSASIDATIEDFNEKSEVYVFSDTHDLLVYKNNEEEMDDTTIFSMWINCGKDKQKAIMFDVEIDELEEFANAILKQIEIVRKNYSEQIKFQTDKGCRV
jgi:hypothetical protein